MYVLAWCLAPYIEATQGGVVVARCSHACWLPATFQFIEARARGQVAFATSVLVEVLFVTEAFRGSRTRLARLITGWVFVGHRHLGTDLSADASPMNPLQARMKDLQLRRATAIGEARSAAG